MFLFVFLSLNYRITILRGPRANNNTPFTVFTKIRNINTINVLAVYKVVYCLRRYTIRIWYTSVFFPQTKIFYSYSLAPPHTYLRRRRQTSQRRVCPCNSCFYYRLFFSFLHILILVRYMFYTFTIVTAFACCSSFYVVFAANSHHVSI